MEYRALGRTGMKVSEIGLGTEHIGSSPRDFDRILGTFVEAGGTFADLLYTGADYWNAFGPILRPYREHMVLAAHWGTGVDAPVDEDQAGFDNVLRAVGNDRVEVAMLTMVDTEDKWNRWGQESLERLQGYRDRGQVGAIGLSGHVLPVALKAVNSGLIDVLMYPMNMLRHDSEEETALLEACRRQGVGLVAMKVYNGGTLLSIGGEPTGITPAQCLAYVLSLPVATTVPGPRTVEQLRATLSYLEASEEERAFAPALATLHERLAGHCVYCQHCLPCPQGIEVGWVIWFVDQAGGRPHDDLKKAYSGYQSRASQCNECGLCLERCPFGVDIMAKLQEAVELFES